MKALYLLACSLTTCIALNAQATSLAPGKINIKQINNLPAACLPEDEGKGVELRTAFVEEIPRTNNGQPYQWEINLAADSKPFVLAPGQCITFGQAIGGYKQDANPLPFVPGRSYEFGLRSNHQEGGWDGRLYAALFCVQKNTDGSVSYLPYIERAGGYATYPVCGRYIGRLPAPDGAIPPDMPQR